MSFVIHQGDALAVLRGLPVGSFDACLCDPPYGLTEKRNLRSATPRKSSRETRRSGGFMGMLWDQDVPGADVWLQLSAVLKPGAHLIAFGGTRTHHRLMCAIEDSGLELRDTLCWLFGQGFPKSLDLGDGFGSALKPAWEPIVLARVPTEGNLTENFHAFGTGAIAVDASRIPTGEDLGGSGQPPMAFRGENHRPSHNRQGEPSAERTYGDRGATNFSAKPGPRGGDHRGRWPANVLLDEEAAGELDTATGTLTSGANPTRRNSDKFRNAYQPYAGADCIPARGADSGGASRFFYCAKASSDERGEGNTHPTVKPLTLLRYLAGLILPPKRDTPRRLIVPYSGSGSEMIAGLQAGWDEVVGIEGDAKYIDIAHNRAKTLLVGDTSISGGSPA